MPPSMTTDNELLRDFARSGSESAFAELVRKHLNMVYSAAIREMAGRTQLAEEVAQEVFVELARQARGLADHPALAGWLYTSVRRIAANLRRAEARRSHRQLEYHSMSQLHSAQADPDWEQIRPVIDDVLHELNESDRTAIVLRYFEDRPLKDIGAQLGITENGARMRVERALARLEPLLARRGIRSAAAVLAVALLAGGSIAAPPALAAKITAAAAGGAVAASLRPAGAFRASRLLLVGAGGGLLGSIYFAWSHPGFLLHLHQLLLR